MSINDIAKCKSYYQINGNFEQISGEQNLCRSERKLLYVGKIRTNLTHSCCFAHIFKIMCVPQTIITFRAPPQPIQVLRSGRGGEIGVPYIRCLGGWVPETYELWALAKDGVHEVHPYARVKL